MQGNCPVCRAPLEMPESGAYQCRTCRAQFEVVLGNPRPIEIPSVGPAPWPVSHPVATLPTLDPAQHAPCANHSENPAQHVCERCGDFICRLCATPVEGRLYCPKCFDLLYRRGSLQVAQRQFQLHGITFGLGLSGFVTSLGCSCLGAPLAAGALVAGALAFREYRERPDLPGRGLTKWGIGLAVAGVFASCVWLAVWFVPLLRR